MSAQPTDGDSSNPPLAGGSGGEGARGGDLGNPGGAPQGRDSSNPPADSGGNCQRAASRQALEGGSGGEAARGGETPEDETWPIGFMIILTLVVLYLGWRLVQGVGWVIDKL